MGALIEIGVRCLLIKTHWTLGTCSKEGAYWKEGTKLNHYLNNSTCIVWQSL